MSVIVAILAGSAWRRWYGQPQHSWLWWMKESDPDYPGIRPAQHVIALAGLGAICFWAGYPLWESALRSFLAWGFLTWVAQSIPHVWKFFDLVNEHVSLRRGSSWFNGETTYAEWTCGAIVWGLACAL